MIIRSLEIEDFKQFHGNHTFTPGPDGIVAVIGQNGAGKTTLFKAIEWCLFQPSSREMPLKEIVTRGKGGTPRVKLTLQRPTDGVEFVIERRLKRDGKSTNAEVYRADQPEGRIVEGSKEVTRYIQKTLIGLDHKAFIATFFTRQKELSFFGTAKPAERRRDVGRLLGMERIRIAQELIREERNIVKAEAGVKTREANRKKEEHDYDAEVRAAQELVEQAEAAVSAAEAVAAQRRREREAADAEVAKEQDRERQDQAIEGRIAQAGAGEERAVARIARADEELRVIADAETKLAAVAARAATAEDAEQAVQRFDQLRAAAEEVRRQRRLIELADRDLDDTSCKVGDEVRALDAGDLRGWHWLPADRTDLIAGIDRLIEAAAAIDLDAAERRLEAVQAARGAAAEVQQREKHYASCLRTLATIDDEIAQIFATGDPQEPLTRIADERVTIAKGIAAEEAAIASKSAEQQKLTALIGRLRQQSQDEPCPTCGRPFDAQGLATMLRSLASTERQTAEEIAEHRVKLGELKTADRDAASRHTQEQERKDKLIHLQARKQSGAGTTDTAHRDLESAQQSLSAVLSASGWAAPPTESDLAAAKAGADRARSAGRTIARLQGDRQAVERSLRDRESAEKNIAALGNVAYDEVAHATSRAALQDARDAELEATQLTAMVARRGAVTAERAEAEAECAAAINTGQTASTERKALAFDPALLTLRMQERDAAGESERAAWAETSRANVHATERRGELDAIRREQEEVERTLREAGDLIRRGEELDEMDKQFVAFEQFVATQLAPRLSDLTSEMVRAITEDKYDRVEFDENYGIRVFDGPDESFPLEEFSGGERDVIALCARLALSELIGEQAANPPGFLVLDEVFGALDRDRRTQTLETLGSLANAANVFSQMFVISHVDDVRQSPLFNEVWRVTERKDGVSDLEFMNETQGTEEF